MRGGRLGWSAAFAERVVLLWLGLLLVGGVGGPFAADRAEVWGAEPEVGGGEPIELSPAVVRLLDDPVIPAAERRAMALFHGQWDRLDDPTVAERAAVALYRYELDDPVLRDDAVPVAIRGEAALLRGEADRALELLEGVDTPRGGLLRGRALALLGRTDEAVAALRRASDPGVGGSAPTAEALTTAALALDELGRVLGEPAEGYHRAMAYAARAHEEVDRLYWPAYLAEAGLLLEKDNAGQAADALLQALRLNPVCGRAWYLLGRQAAEGFNFGAAEQCLARLRSIGAAHPLADQLEADIRLKQLDPRGALDVLEGALRRYPARRELVARRVAAEVLAASRFAANTSAESGAALPAAVKAYSERFPTDALGPFLAGKYLSLARQYPGADRMLRAAVARAPGWPRPRVELGLLLMQWGREEEAAQELKVATRLDPFNRRAINQSILADELLTYEQVRTDHFVIKYHDPIDRVLAVDMADEVERIYADVTGAFGHEPANPTLIEILPDERRFAVRITGRTEIWTIAACTGDVIALTPPRVGARQRGTFDWPRVLRHEFTHTVTLDMTGYRVPHWFTEACAVSQEPAGRADEDCRMLAGALVGGRLFGLDEINWAFVRPKSPEDRPLAYAQASWMLQFIAEAFGHGAVLEMLGAYGGGARDAEAISAVTGLDSETFVARFKRWAHKQVRSWGYLPPAPDDRIKRLLSEVRDADRVTPAARARLEELLRERPDHPGLLRLAAEIAVRRDGPERAREQVLRYARVRPTDPWPDRVLVDLAAEAGRPGDAVAQLEALDAHEQGRGDLAARLAAIYRSAGRLDAAAAAADRALHHEPYNATFRELAAAIELQRGRPDRALRHLIANTVLEPDRAVHHTRLAALYARLGRVGEADAAARRARALDPDAPVGAFLAPAPGG